MSGGESPPPQHHPRPDILVKTTAADNKVTHRQIDKIMQRALQQQKTACKHNKEQ